MRTRFLLVFSAAVAAAAPLLADSEAVGGPFEGNLGNVLWTLVVFGLVLFVLGKFAWGPILSGLQERESFIRRSLEEAREDRVKAEQRLKEYTDQLNAARTEATAIVEEARRDADAARRRIEEEARAESQKVIERAKREIGLAKEGAVKELYDLSARVTTEIVSRVLKREINAQDHERLIRDALTSLLERSN